MYYRTFQAVVKVMREITLECTTPKELLLWRFSLCSSHIALVHFWIHMCTQMGVCSVFSTLYVN